jgi:hypothetical protein
MTDAVENVTGTPEGDEEQPPLSVREAIKEVQDLLKRPEPKPPPPDDYEWVEGVKPRGPIYW